MAKPRKYPRTCFIHPNSPTLKDNHYSPDIRRHLWGRFQPISAPRVHPPAPLATFPAVFVAKGTPAGTCRTVIGDYRRQGYIRRHLWQRFQPISAPRVHPSAPLGTFPATFGTANGSAHKDKKLSNLPCPDEMPLLGGGKCGYSRHDGNWNHGPEHCRHHKKQQQSGQFIGPCVNKTESFADNQG